MTTPAIDLRVGGQQVATYVIRPSVDRTMSPRPYVHPIKTLAGTVVTDTAPEDHRWHMGLSLAVQDVNGTNLWGGRTYVRGQGYTWLDDHGTITHEGFDSAEPDRITEQLVWRARNEQPLLLERRELRADLVDDRTWALTVQWALTAPERVTLGSPTTNGREHGAGYGGCFVRLASAPDPVVTAGDLVGEAQVNGCDVPEMVWRCKRYTVRFEGGPRWFVRTSMYPGVCAAWAFDEVKVIEPGETWQGRFRMVISDPE